MVTYNGVEYIKEQLTSILNQTVKPDEVIISDDGSSDGSIELIKRIIDDYSNSGISISLLTDNPIHGVGTNYDWAYRHTSGDIIFSAGQDDIWAPNKIESVLRVYMNHPDAQVVITDAQLIDEQGNKISKRFCPDFIDSLNILQGETKRVERIKYIEYAESTILVSGPVISFKSTLKDSLLPLPHNCYEDQWIEVIGIIEDSLYFLKEKTTYYRIHNSETHSEGSSLWQKIKKDLRRTKTSYTIALAPYNYGNALLTHYDEHPADFDGRDAAIDTVYHIISIGKKVLECMKMGRIKGSVNLIRFYRSDTRYRKSGFQQFFLCLLYIVLYSRKKRNRDINNEIAKFNNL